MKRIEFKQTDSAKLMLLGIMYFALLSAFFLYAVFGDDSIVNFINSQDSSVVGLLGGLVLIGPLLLLIPFTSYRLSVDFDNEIIRVQDKNKEIIIRYSDIDMMYLNRKRLNELELIDIYSKPLFSFRAVNDGYAIDKIIAIITKEIVFKKTTVQRRKIGKYPFITYKRTN